MVSGHVHRGRWAHEKKAGGDRSVRAETYPLCPGSGSDSLVMVIGIMFAVCGTEVWRRECCCLSTAGSGGGLAAEGCAVKFHEHGNAMRKQSYH